MRLSDVSEITAKPSLLSPNSQNTATVFRDLDDLSKQEKDMLYQDWANQQRIAKNQRAREIIKNSMHSAKHDGMKLVDPIGDLKERVQNKEKQRLQQANKERPPNAIAKPNSAKKTI